MGCDAGDGDFMLEPGLLEGLGFGVWFWSGEDSVTGPGILCGYSGLEGALRKDLRLPVASLLLMVVALAPVGCDDTCS